MFKSIFTQSGLAIFGPTEEGAIVSFLLIILRLSLLPLLPPHQSHAN